MTIPRLHQYLSILLQACAPKRLVQVVAVHPLTMHLEVLMAKHGCQAAKLEVSAEVEVGCRRRRLPLVVQTYLSILLQACAPKRLVQVVAVHPLTMHLEVLMAKHGCQAAKLEVSAEVEVGCRRRRLPLVVQTYLSILLQACAQKRLVQVVAMHPLTMHLEVLVAKHGCQAAKLEVSAELEVGCRRRRLPLVVQEVQPTRCCWAQ